MNDGYAKKLDIAIVGGGLVGSLEALYLAKRGYNVRLYEYREDIRKTPQVRGRSINLALSVRGRTALRDVGLEEHMINEHGIPMRGRMIHKLDGATYDIPYDARSNQLQPQLLKDVFSKLRASMGQECLSDLSLLSIEAETLEKLNSSSAINRCIYSIGRNYLNGLLLKESEKYENVERYFNHKLIDANLRNGSLTFLKSDTKETVPVKADLIIGADGAFSSVRKAMMKQPLFDYSQTYIQHGYLELCIPPNDNGGMPANYLHIWPRGTFMMIALPNQDCSWTVTLFMPFENFKKIQSDDDLLNFFELYFPDAIPLIGKDKLIENFFAGTASPLVAVKCRPYNVEDKALIIGDAAHAVVPFYGQGMNAGFEDCTILDRLLNEYRDDIASVLTQFSKTRWQDTFAVSDLAMYNYIEMRDLVTRPTYQLRKAIDDFLFWVLPHTWVPLYNSVTFTTMSYSQCVKNRQWQDKILKAVVILCVSFMVLLVLLFSK